MRRLLTGLLLAAALAGTAAAAQPARVLAVEWEAGGGKLRWVSPTTLRPVGPAALNVGGAPANIVAVSPDRTLAAIGGGERGRLRFVRLNGLRPAGLMWLGGGSIYEGTWAAPDRLVVLIGGVQPEVVVVDPASRKILRRERLSGLALGVERAGDRLLTLLAPRARIGPAALAVIDADGTVRTVPLTGIQAGFARPTPEAAGRQASPAVVADGSRAVVLGVDRLVEVNLETLAVRNQALIARSTQRVSKVINGWGRSGVWLRGSTIAYTGWTTADTERPRSIGVLLLDVLTGASRMLDERAGAVTRTGDTLLVYGHDELRGYRFDASKRFTVLEGTDTGYVQIAGRHAYVGSGNSTRFAVVDVTTGRIVGLARTDKPTVLLQP
jgi:hypothetical protein